MAEYLFLWNMARGLIANNSCLPWCGKRDGLGNDDGRAWGMSKTEWNPKNNAPETNNLCDFLKLCARGNDQKVAELLSSLSDELENG